MGGKKSEKRTQGLGMAPTMAAAASVTGLPMWTISAAKDGGCEAFRARGDVDCDKLLAWLAEHPEIAEEKGVINKELEEALRIRVDRHTREHKLSELKRRVIPNDEVKRTYTRSVLAAKSKLSAAARAMAMAMRMKYPDLPDEVFTAVEDEANKHIRDAMRALSKGEWNMPKCPACEHEL